MGNTLAQHRLLFRLKCTELMGVEFQTFFEKVMVRADRTFTAVKPMGSAGDWKCDGYSAATNTVYQCYSPESLTAARACDKILSDFIGAKDHWGSQMKRWVFVWNARALPPQVVSLLQNLQIEHPDVEIDQLGRDKLWDAVLSQLGHGVLNELLGEVSSNSETASAHIRFAKRAIHGGDPQRIREICLEVLALSEGDDSLSLIRAEAFEVLTILALSESDLHQAHLYLQHMATHIQSEVRAAVRANYHRLLGLALSQEGKEEDAEAEFLAALNVRSLDDDDPHNRAKLSEIQCAAKADLVLYWCQQEPTARAIAVANEIAGFVHARHSELTSHAIPHAVDALVTLAACLKDQERATDALKQLDEHCTSKELATDASSVLQRLAGRLGHFFDQPDIAMACCELAVKMAKRADRDDFHWAAVYNMAAAYFQKGELEEASNRLNVLLPLLDSAQVDDAIKAAVLSLASELASDHGDIAKAVDYQERMIRYAAANPINMIAAQHGVGRKLYSAGRVSEAFDAFVRADQLARECEIPGEAQFDILTRLAEAGILIGRWKESEDAIGRLSMLPRPRHIVDDAIEQLRKQFDGTREMRSRIEAIKNIEPLSVTHTLVEANAAAVKPLLAWWRDIEKSGCWFAGDKAKSGATDDQDRGLRVLYDYWGGGGAARVMANLRRFAPDHFSPFIEVRSADDIRLAIRMFSLISDVLVLLWKGRTESQQTATFVPIRDVVGGAGYIGFFGTILKSPSGIPWVGAIGYGTCLPEDICRLLFTEASGLLEQGRLIVLPAPAVGCWQSEYGPCEKLLVDLMGTTPLLHRSKDQDASPVGFVPFFDDAPIPAIVDLLGERPEQTRRLRLALTKRTRELRNHGSLEAGKRELQDEIQDAFAEWSAIHRSLGGKHEWQSRRDELSSTALRFEDQWSPIFMLNQLGYRLRVQALDRSLDPSSTPARYNVKEGTPFGSWLLPPGPHILSAEAKVEESATGTSSDTE
jgi:tetratricopeptide (TPR) repeat protein